MRSKLSSLQLPEGQVANGGSCQLLRLFQYCLDRLTSPLRELAADAKALQIRVSTSVGNFDGELHIFGNLCYADNSLIASSVETSSTAMPSCSASSVTDSGGAIFTVWPHAPTGAKSNRPRW
jgi:hypothetical protein